MPRDVNGNYSLPSGNPVVTSTTITASWANTTLQDIASALTNSLSIDGSVTAAKLASNSVATAKIQDDAVTPPKLAGLDVDGMVARISASEFEGRTITGTTGQIDVTNGDGVSGNPTLALATEVYRRANILGTVSQSGGVPTGPIIERGSNANGEYTRFADGTQICVHSVAIGAWGADASSTATWTFPAAFSATPTVTATLQTTTPHLHSAGAVPSSATAAAIYAGGSTSTSGTVEVMAIGAWF